MEPVGPPNHFRWVRALLNAWAWLWSTKAGGLLALLIVVGGAMVAFEKNFRELGCRYYDSTMAICTVARPPDPTPPPPPDVATPSPPPTPPIPSECDRDCLRKEMQEFRANYELKQRAGQTPPQERVSDGHLLTALPVDTLSVHCPNAQGSLGTLPTTTTVNVAGDKITIRAEDQPDAEGKRQTQSCEALRTSFGEPPRVYEAPDCRATTAAREIRHVAGYQLSCKPGQPCWVCTSNRENPQQSVNVLLAFETDPDRINWARAFVRWSSEDGSDWEFCLERTAQQGRSICSSLSREKATKWRDYQRGN